MPRPRFTLRVALAVTAIVALLAWQWSLVYRRKAAMQVVQPVSFILAVRQPGHSSPTPTVNPLRALLGDHAVSSIQVLAVAGCEATADHLGELFPEAEVEIVHPQPASD